MSNEYESNSQEDLKPIPVEPLTGVVMVRKPSVWHKLSQVFFSTDLNNTKDFLVWGVLIPNAKLFMLKSINDAFGGNIVNYNIVNNPLVSTRRTTTGSWFDENVSWGSPKDVPSDPIKKKPDQTVGLEDVENLYYGNMEDAVMVREKMYRTAKQFKYATMADLCRYSPYYNPQTRKRVDIEPKWSYQYIGWTADDVNESHVEEVFGFKGRWWTIVLPQIRDLRNEMSQRYKK